MRKKIHEGDTVKVKFSVRERELLLEHTLMDAEYGERLKEIPGKLGLVGGYTLEDLEDMLGYLAAEANHTEDTKLQTALDRLYDKLLRIQRSYDDGGWNDSRSDPPPHVL